jgi:hypothetical protein
MTPGLSLQELEILEKIPSTLTERLESRLEEVVSFPKLDGDSNITEMFFRSDPIFHELCLDFFRYNWYGSDIFKERKLID